VLILPPSVLVLRDRQVFSKIRYAALAVFFKAPARSAEGGGLLAVPLRLLVPVIRRYRVNQCSGEYKLNERIIMINFTKFKHNSVNVFSFNNILNTNKNKYKGFILHIDICKIEFPSFNSLLITNKNKYNGFILNNNNEYKFEFPKLVYKDLNVFKQLQPSELQHSLILGTLLDPNEKHGFKDLFLKEYFNTVIADENFKYDNSEKWIVTIEKGHFDISIRNGNSTKIIIIENKSNGAGDQPNQLYRYWLRGIYNTQTRLKKLGIRTHAKIIYLSPSFEKQYSEQSITAPIELENFPNKVPKEIIKTVYFGEEIVNWLEKCMSLIDNTDDVFFYIKQYIDYWR
jgi:hypothetical protein